MSTIAAGAELDVVPVSQTGVRAVLRTLRRDRWACASAAVIALWVLAAVFAPVLTGISGHDPYTYDVGALDENGVPTGVAGGVSSSHWLGVEPLTGRDLFAMVVYGARTSLLIGLSATLLAVSLGVVVGLTTGFVGGWYDRLGSRFVDVMFGFPVLVFMIALTTIAPSWLPRWAFMVLIIGLFGWPGISRIVRAQVLSLREREFVAASIAMGAPPRHAMARHVLPNVTPTIIVISTILVPLLIGVEAALSFLGVGVTPPTPSWGRMLGDAIAWVQTDPMYLVVPGVALFSVTLAFNVLGDSLRDALDPRRLRR